jgi:fermentation-respiration switch protein FrsA (DUF1100 family)
LWQFFCLAGPDAQKELQDPVQRREAQISPSTYTPDSQKSGAHAGGPRLKNALIWIAAILLVLFLIVYFGIGAYAANALTTPKRQFDTAHNPGVYGLEYEEITFPSRDGEAQIAAWFIPAPENDQVVILVHGNNASRTREFDDLYPALAAGLNKGGLNVLMIDLRGHGQSSDGRVTFGQRERQDVLGAVDELLGQGFEPGKIGIYGVSLGSAAGIGAAAAEPAVGALAVDSPFAEVYPVIQAQWGDASGLPDLFLTPTRWMIRLLYGYDLATSKPVEEIGGLAPRPVLIAHCTTDTYVPVEHTELLHAAAPGSSLWLIEGCDHARSYNQESAAYETRLADFFTSHLK